MEREMGEKGGWGGKKGRSVKRKSRKEEWTEERRE